MQFERILRAGREQGEHDFLPKLLGKLMMIMVSNGNYLYWDNNSCNYDTAK